MNLRRLEEISQNASRAERGLMIDGWSVGLSPGLAKRSRCVNPFYPSTRPFAENFVAAETAFASASLPLIFRLTPFVPDATLDVQLEARGLIRYDTTLVQVLALTELQLDPVRSPGATFQANANYAEAAAWVGEMRGDNASEVTGLAARWQYCAGRVEPMFAFDINRERVARAVTIAEDGVVGIFDVGTLEAHRGHGFATALIAHQLINARERGAHTAYLQVTPENTSRRIYERLGFRTAYEYCYRAMPQVAR